MAQNTTRDPKAMELMSLENEFSTETPESDQASPREAFLQDVNHCCLCGHQLRFEHLVDFLQLTVLESASCEPCKIQLRKRLFTLN